MTFTELNRRVVRGESGGKIIWQPRIGAWLADKLFEKEELPGRFKGMARLSEIYRELNCSARPYEFGASYVRKEHPSVRLERKTLSSSDEEISFHTPVGVQTILWRRTATSRRKIMAKHEIETEKDLRVAAWRENHCSWEWSQTTYDRTMQEWNGLGLPAFTVTPLDAGYYGPRVNIQELFTSRMGVENTIYALADWPAAVDEFCEASNNSFGRLIDVINASPIDMICFGDNHHASTMPPALFRKYVMPEYQRRCEKLHRAGKFVCSHWDGDVKPLLPLARELGLDGIEAITPQPQGDVTLEETRAALGDKLFLFDGIPAILFDDMYPVSMLRECAQKVIDLFAPNLVLGISDEISAHGNIERICVVSEIVDRYNSGR